MQKAKRLTNTIAFLACIAGVACASGIACSSESSPASGPTADKSCTDFAAALCAKVNTCSPILLQASFVDLATCTDRYKKSCLSGLAAPSTGNTPSNLAGCDTAIPTATCGEIFSGHVPPACQPVAGKLADGAACGDDAQCKSKFCSAGETIVCGQCGAPLAENGDCTTSGKCGPGLECVNKKCVTLGVAGDACSADKPCRPFSGLACNDGKCGTSAKNGEACNLDGTGKPNCANDQGLFCVPDSPSVKDGKCGSVRLVKPSEKCGITIGPPITFTACDVAGVCQKAKPDDAQGTCVAPAADGQACDDTAGPGCVLPARCVNKVCQFPDPATCR